MPQVGVLALTNADEESLSKQLREGLHHLGYVQAQNFGLVLRSADGNASQLPELAAELVRLTVDVIAATFTPCALRAKQATTSIPIVMIAVGDPVGTGLVASLANAVFKSELVEQTALIAP